MASSGFFRTRSLLPEPRSDFLCVRPPLCAEVTLRGAIIDAESRRIADSHPAHRHGASGATWPPARNAFQALAASSAPATSAVLQKPRRSVKMTKRMRRMAADLEKAGDQAPAQRYAASIASGLARSRHAAKSYLAYSPVYPAFTGSLLPSSWRR
jgi:hypothetical protein